MWGSESEIKVHKFGALGLLTLNRPAQLNALTHGMIRTMTDALENWALDDTIKSVGVMSEHERAFCAGGDIRVVRESVLEGSDAGLALLKDEYRLNALIGEYKKPYIAFLNGIVMGGGAGISVHGRYRLAESIIFAMPETGIGFIPDVGASYFLPRCVGETGTYLALVGTPIQIGDAVYCGLVTHKVERRNFSSILDGLAEGKDPDRVIGPYACPTESEFFAEFRANLDEAFGAASVQSVLDRLDRQGSELSGHIAAVIRTRSPTALKLTLRELRRGKSLSLRQCLAMEYRLASRVIHTYDFSEGVRAVLVDKRRVPQWNPANLAAVPERVVEDAFKPLGADELF